MLEISKMLTLSTAHITKETAEVLGDKDNFIPVNWTDFLSIYDKADYGWWICLADIDIPELLNGDNPAPADFLKCVQLAAQNGCDWLCLDCDGPVEDCLPTYEWEES